MKHIWSHAEVGFYVSQMLSYVFILFIIQDDCIYYF